MVHDPGVSARWWGREARGALMDREVGGGAALCGAVQRAGF